MIEPPHRRELSLLRLTAETSGAPLDLSSAPQELFWEVGGSEELRFCDAELAAKMRVLPAAAPEV